jgi:hypothetical protein
MKQYHFDHIDMFKAFDATRGLVRVGDHETAVVYLSLLGTVLMMPGIMVWERYQEFLRTFG